VSSGAFVTAGELSVGDEVLTAGGARLSVTAVVLHEQDLIAYNLSISEIHTYYAGDAAVLVHNRGGGACEFDAEGIAHAQKNHTLGGSGVRPNSGLWDPGVDLHELASATRGLEGIAQAGSKDSIMYQITAKEIIGTAGNGQVTNVYQVFRDLWNGDLITLFPVAP
jgi:hypothetical protein